MEWAWLANAVLQLLFISDLRVLDENIGGKGYRHAMLGAGARGQLAYLSATCRRLVCGGRGPFYDEEAAAFCG